MGNKVVYHKNCMDGFVAALIMKEALGGAVELFPYNYGQEPPEVSNEDTLFIVDFSFKREVIESLADKARAVVILDHHKTAEADLAGFKHPKVHIIFDMNRSGARIAWDYCYPIDLVPDLVKYVEDRDLWRWALRNSKEYSAALWSYPLDFDGPIRDFLYENHTERLITEGKAILAYMATQVEAICSRATLRRLDNHIIPVCNATTLFSEVGERLIEKFNSPFSAYWFVREDGRYQYGLRSRGEFDVSEVAKKFGGGGHKNAAGFESPTRVDI